MSALRAETFRAEADAARIIDALACGRSGCPCVVTQRRGHGNVHCPGPLHQDGDRNPSLTVTTKNDRTLVNCKGPCSQEALLDTLRSRGLWGIESVAQPKLARPRGTIVSQVPHAIRSASGDLAATHTRREWSNGDKDFYWKLPDGTLGLNGTACGDLPLFGTERLANAEGQPIVIAEGEKATLALQGLGILALGTVTGADGAPNVGALEVLRGREVYLWPDADSIGQEHMAKVAVRLQSIGITARMVHWAEAPAKGDAADFVSRGGDRAAVEQLLASANSILPPLKREVAAERKIIFHTAREIGESTPAEPEWIAAPWVAKGAITEIDGKIKAAGKTTFTTHMAAAILNKADFIGQPTHKTKIVYLTEQAPRTFRVALKRAGLLERDDLSVLFWHETSGTPWATVVRAAIAECQRIGAELLFVDTLGQFAGLAGDAENNAGAALEAMAPLQEAAAVHNLAVVVTRHERKSGGEVGESARGSSAFAGAVDVVLVIRRPEGNGRLSIRVIHALSRFDETPDELYIELTEAGYLALGNEAAVAVREARQAVLDVIPADEGKAMTWDEIMEALKGFKRTTTQEAVGELLGLGVVVRKGAGKKGDPYRHWQREHEEIAREINAEFRSAASPVVAAERISNQGALAEIHSAATPSLYTAESNGLDSEGPEPTCVDCGDPLTGDRQYRCEVCTARARDAS